MDASLNALTDHEAAMQWNVTRTAVRKRRMKLGIVVERAIEPKWTKQQLKQLGCDSDNKLAEQFGVSPYWIRKARADRGIPAYVPPQPPATVVERSESHLWTSQQEARLGSTFDTELADEWGILPTAVTRRRNQLGIAPFRRGGEIEWTKAMLRRLGTVPDGTFARDYDTTHMAVKIKRIQQGILPYGKSEMDPEPELPLDVINQIGIVTDAELSRTYGVARAKIRIYRALNGIELAEVERKAAYTWSPKDDALLGTMSDGKVASRLNITKQMVGYRRKQLGTQPYGTRDDFRWTKKRVEELGAEPDAVLGRRWKISPREVRQKREALQVPACERTQAVLPDVCREQLGTKPDTELAREFGFSATFIRNERNAAGIKPFRTSAAFKWTQKAIAQLGKIADSDLAIKLGVSVQFVAAKRCSLGIPAKRRPHKIDWQDPKVIKLLGTVSDQELARKWGVTSGAVSDARRRRGIASFQP